VFRPIISIGMVIMAMFGGIGTVTGPIIGAVLLNSISEATWSRLPEFHRAVYGALIIMVVLFLPGGIVTLLRRARLLPPRSRI
jgi:branched-chain amino acid transport system permease protein